MKRPVTFYSEGCHSRLVPHVSPSALKRIEDSAHGRVVLGLVLLPVRQFTKKV